MRGRGVVSRSVSELVLSPTSSAAYSSPMSRTCQNLAALGLILAAPFHATLAQASADTARKAYNTADVGFVSGMISHHAQAVLMAGWAPTHGASASIQSLCDRIVVAQNDEIAVLQRWLRERHLPVPPADPRGEV